MNKSLDKVIKENDEIFMSPDMETSKRLNQIGILTLTPHAHYLDYPNHDSWERCFKPLIKIELLMNESEAILDELEAENATSED